jgi:hypothetical protein
MVVVKSLGGHLAALMVTALLLLVTATWAASVDTSSDEFGSLQRRMFSFGVGDSCVALPFQTVAPRVFRCTSPERVAPL